MQALLMTYRVLTIRFFYVSHLTPKGIPAWSLETNTLTLHTRLHEHDTNTLLEFSFQNYECMETL